ncbi:HipA domain-containing protein [Nocardioides dubius]|uniref:Serine/threonine-protein kinase HipA n=1 Tax=Nocardioides dubius TaxID=317019 RepID=A0ABP4EE64_9ACTN
MSALILWLHGVPLARIERDLRRTNAPIKFTWTDRGVEAFKGLRVLSTLMRVGDSVSPVVAKVYLDGLLPEGNARKNYAIAAGVSDPDDTYGLLERYGADTPGAAVIVVDEAGDPTAAGSYEPITIDEVAMRIRHADEHSRADNTGIAPGSSALPGMVPKIALHRAADGSWLLPKGGAPSTWILKRAGLARDGDDVIDTEVLCLELARAVGLSSVHAEILDFGDVRAIAVSRYDRRDVGGRIERLHQEDFAQALGVPAQDVNAKFQWGRTRPTLALIAAVLGDAGASTIGLARLAAFSWIVGNTDMHAKNLSLTRTVDDVVDIAPAYDVSMRLHHSGSREFALDYNGVYRADDTTVEHVIAEIASWDGWTVRRARRLVADLARDLNVALASTNLDHHPGVSVHVLDTVRDRINLAAEATRNHAPNSVAAPTGPGAPATPKPRRRS